MNCCCKCSNISILMCIFRLSTKKEWIHYARILIRWEQVSVCWDGLLRPCWICQDFKQTTTSSKGKINKVRITFRPMLMLILDLNPGSWISRCLNWWIREWPFTLLMYFMNLIDTQLRSLIIPYRLFIKKWLTFNWKPTNWWYEWIKIPV